MTRPTLILRVTFLLLAVSGCSGAPPSGQCTNDTSCPAGQACRSGACTAVSAGDCTAGQERPCGPAEVGACRKGTQRCVDGAFETVCRNAVMPSPEQCNGVDDDCDGAVDEDVAQAWYADRDGDGFGAGAPTQACTQPAGFVASNTDCNDAPGAGASIHPGAMEVCDAANVDEDCSGAANEGCGCTLGATQPCCSGRGVQTCQASGGGATLSACSVSPGLELCNGIDDDCDGQVDEQAAVSADGGVVALDGGSAMADGTCTLGVGACASSGAVSCSAGALTCNAPTRAPGAETCNGLDDDCDGQVDEAGPGLCSVTGQLCTRGACACPPGQSVCNGSCVVLTAEVCDGVDNNCDGRVDENLTIACLADPDGDGYASSTTPSQQCPNASRPQAGNCPLGWVAAPQSLGLDCAPSNGGAYQLVMSRTDADADQRCVGGGSLDCVGTSALPGRRFFSDCNPTDDCDDTSNARYQLMSSRNDVDGDGFCTGASAMDCTGPSPLAGRRFTANCNQPDDCNDADRNVFRIAGIREDRDNDQYCNGNPVSQCIGNAAPAGFRIATACLGDDCRDTNNQATTTCTLPNAYTTAYRSQTCPNGAQTSTVSPLTLCPIGFVLSGYRAEKLNGNGFCTAVSETSITQTCNFLEGSTCRVVGDCVALPVF